MLFLTFFTLVAAVAAVAIPVAPLSKVVYAQPEAPAQYDFSYSVQDSHTGDIKLQQESRRGDAVHGSYSLVQPDGVNRIVEYTADEHQGFNAIVRYEGSPITKAAYAPAPIAKIAYAPAPIAKVAYAPAPITKITYAAPVSKIAYSPAPITYAAPARVTYAQAPQISYTAPINKVAYTENLGRVTFSSPVISYQH